MNDVQLGRHAVTSNEIRTLGSVEAHLRLWVADPSAFVTDDAVRERLTAMKKSMEVLGYV